MLERRAFTTIFIEMLWLIKRKGLKVLKSLNTLIIGKLKDYIETSSNEIDTITKSN